MKSNNDKMDDGDEKKIDDNIGHTIKHIEIINPELGRLIKRAEAVYLLMGGDGNKKIKKNKKKKMTEYESLKTEVVNRTNNIERIKGNLESGIYAKDSADYIRMKNVLRNEYELLKTDVNNFSNIQPKNEEDIQTKNDVIASAISTIPIIASKIPELNIKKTTVDDIINGNYNPKKIREEVLTPEQQTMLTQIDEEYVKQNELLGTIEAGLGELNQIAQNAKDVLSAQNQVIVDITEKVEKTTNNLQSVNERTKDLLKKIDSKSGKFCTYAICLIILFAASMILYTTLK